MSKINLFPNIGNATKERHHAMTNKVEMNLTDGLAALARGMIQTARDAAFNAVTSAALARIAAHQDWAEGGQNARKVADVDAEFADLFQATNKKSNAYRWIALSKKVSVKANKELANTLDAAKQATDADSAFSLFNAALKAAGIDTLDKLEAWAAGNAKKPAEKSAGQKVITAVKNHGETFSDAELKELQAMLSAIASARAKAIADNIKAKKAA